MIIFSGVSKTYGDFTALAPTSVTFDTGITTVIIGPSGCGKSTILRLINGLIAPTNGSISIGGQQLQPASRLKLRQQMGYVIQDGGLFPHLTAEKNITLLAEYLKTPKERIDVRLKDLCSLTHFDAELLVRFPSELSGGQRQRVSLMRALMMDPQVLLLDEPLAALDPMVRSLLQTELKQIFSTLNKTVILVTHDLREAAYLADVIVLMDQGNIVQTGSIDKLIAEPKSEFVSAFIAAQKTPVAL